MSPGFTDGPIGFGTGALLEWDAKNADYPVAAVLDPSAALVSKAWALQTRINQGNEPECVGASLGQELNAEPVSIPISHPWTMHNIYNRAQTLDEWPGEGYPGTSLLAGLKALKSFGYVGEYRWAASVEDVAASLSQLGPVTLAGPWLSGMFTPDATGRIRLTGTAGNIGHAYLLGELDVARGLVYVEQTWGPSFSVLGWRGILMLEDVRTLLGMGTQAAIITQRLDPNAPAPPPTPPAPPAPVRRPTARIDVFSDGDVAITRT